jgi:signal transduction histidine kinase
MRVVSSLSNRIFLACAALATLSLGLAFSFVNARAVSDAEAELRAELVDAAALVDENRAFLTDTFTTMARLIADLPKLKSAVDTGDPPTVQPLATDYRQLVDADLLVVSDPHGRVLGEDGADHPALPLAPGSQEELSLFLPDRRGILQIVSVPILLGVGPTELLGRLTVGFFFDDRLASRFRELTASDIAFAAGGRILASSLPPEAWEPLGAAIGAEGVSSVRLADEEYLVLARAMPRPEAGAVMPAAARPVVLVLRSRTERLRFLNTLRTGLTGALVLTVLLATILSYAVARTMTRPLAAVTGAMRDVAATGDLTRKVAVRSRAWDDEDARLLASTFNTLTESIARFQREAAQRDRLSSLGRLSTVVAHEIRNPLMIIRATLATLRHERTTSTELREAIADIDEETTRLNRLVTEVLDFARPIRFDLAPASVNDVCRASAAAAWAEAGGAGPALELDLDSDVPTIVTDAERLRTVLVNVLTNARHAVHASEGTEPAAAASPTQGARSAAAVLAGAGVALRTRVDRDRVVVTVRDRGRGIAPEDMAHIFDPYFTTRRAGTGLGLPIAKNIVEGLGGTLTARSEAGGGTEIRIELPLRAEAAA